MGIPALAALLLAPLAQTQELPVFEAWVDTDLAEEDLEDIGCMCALWCAIGWSVDATSYLPAIGGHCYEPGMLDDSDIATAWVEGVDGNGEGERIDFLLEKYESGFDDGERHVYPLWGLMLLNGYRRTEGTWNANGRVARALVSVNGEPICIVELADSRQLQHVQLPSTDVGDGDVVSFEILEVFPGDRYEDTALTELILMGAH